MVNPLDDEAVDQLREWAERSKPHAMPYGVSCSDVVGLCATARYWKRKYEHLESVTTGELVAISA